MISLSRISGPVMLCKSYRSNMRLNATYKHLFNLKMLTYLHLFYFHVEGGGAEEEAERGL